MSTYEGIWAHYRIFDVWKFRARLHNALVYEFSRFALEHYEHHEYDYWGGGGGGRITNPFYDYVYF